MLIQLVSCRLKYFPALFSKGFLSTQLIVSSIVNAFPQQSIVNIPDENFSTVTNLETSSLSPQKLPFCPHLDSVQSNSHPHNLCLYYRPNFDIFSKLFSFHEFLQPRFWVNKVHKLYVLQTLYRAVKKVNGGPEAQKC
jgi:hypothetical protein